MMLQQHKPNDYICDEYFNCFSLVSSGDESFWSPCDKIIHKQFFGDYDYYTKFKLIIKKVQDDTKTT
jgi:hypothetical protein